MDTYECVMCVNMIIFLYSYYTINIYTIEELVNLVSSNDMGDNGYKKEKKQRKKALKKLVALKQQRNEINKKDFDKSICLLKTVWNMIISKFENIFSLSKSHVNDVHNFSRGANKKALLIGSNYSNTLYPLDGCIHDIENIETLLSTETLGFTHIVKLTDDQTDPTRKPTKQNIRENLISFVSDDNVKDGDILWLHFSGHGDNETFKSYSKEESDELNEWICTYEDNNSFNFILDDDINAIVSNLNPKATLIAVFDCCHSGTIMDLPFVYDSIITPKSSSLSYSLSNPKQTPTPNIIMLSGCRDNETSADAYFEGGFLKNKYEGALTHCLIQYIEETLFSSSTNNNITFSELLKNVNHMLKKYNYEQNSQMSSNNPIDTKLSFSNLFQTDRQTDRQYIKN